MVFSYHGLIFSSNKKEWIIDTSNNWMNFKCLMLSQKKAEHILYYSMKSRTDRTNMAMKNKNGDCLSGWGIFRYRYRYRYINKKKSESYKEGEREIKRMRNRIGKENLRYQVGITLLGSSAIKRLRKKKNGAGREYWV